MRRHLCRISYSFLVLVLASSALWTSEAQGNTLLLRRLVTDEHGLFTVLFTMLDGNRDPVSDPERLPLPGITMVGGRDSSDMRPMGVVEPILTHLKDYNQNIRIYVLLPNNELFNGPPDDARYPDAAGLRAGLSHALSLLLSPSRDNVFIRVGMYNDTVSWLPEYPASQISSLQQELMRPRWVAGSGTYGENIFQAITMTQRTYLRRGSREGPAFIYYFVIVTSTMTTVETQEFHDEISRVRQLLSGDDMVDVITQVLVYMPFIDDEYLMSDGADFVPFAEGVTPSTGSFRLASNSAAAQTALEQIFDEIWSSFVLRFTNKELETDRNYYFKLSVTPSGRDPLESNVIRASVVGRLTNWWRIIILAGLSLIGGIVLLILVIYLIKRPKKEKEVVEEVVYEAPKLCVQCGRQLRDDLQYCHHCAAEPNYGLLKVIEGPKAGWTFFIRDVVTEIGKNVGNNIQIQDPGISGNHMKLTFQEGGRYMIEDTGSTNGTYIDGQRIQRQFLRNGDVVAIGTSTKIKFTIS